MVARNLTVAHRRVVVTHRPDLLEHVSGIEVVALDDRKHVPGTCFLRLMLHRPDIEELLGPRVWALDVDCVVTGGLDSLVNRDEDYVVWRNPNWPSPRRAFYQTSSQLVTAGARSELWADFDPQETPKWVNRRFGGAEQAWVSERLPWNEAHWTAADGVYGFKRLNGAGIDVELPDDARIVFTPGNREPGQLKAIPWIEEHYR